MHRDETVDLAVYVLLLILTAVTVAASRLELGRIVAVGGAFAIAGAKAALIGLYYMDLREERALIHGIVWAGLAAVLILLLGIMPDVAFRW